MTQENILKLAKQGNPKALAVMLNQSLQPKGIAAKVSRKDDCLQILLESAQIPDQKAMVPYIRNGLIKLEVGSIKTVKVYGRQTGEESSAWSKKFEIVSQQETPSSTEPIDFNNLLSHQTLHKTSRAVPPKVETSSSTRKTDFQNSQRSIATSKNPNPRQPTGPLSVGNVVSTGLRIYRDHFKLYLGLAFRALLWSFVPIYGWAKNFQIQAIISRQVFGELVNQPESVSTIRTQTKPRLLNFLVAQILIWLMCFGVNIGLSILSSIILMPLAIILGVSNDNPEASLILVPIRLVVNLITLVFDFWFYSHFFIAELPLAIENEMSSTSCIARSWNLTKGFVVRVELIVMVAGLITVPIVIIFLVSVFYMIPFLLTSSSPQEVFLKFILATIGSTFMRPFWQAIKAVIYYDLRSRREGLGLEIGDSR